jgi:hypothetical protein
METKPFLEIKISTPNEEGPSVTIHWKDSPDDPVKLEWDAADQAWTKICDGIHALLHNLGPIPEGGWGVEFSCPKPDLIVEDITREDYHNRWKDE